MTNIKCPQCGTINDDAAGQFCKQCGSSLHPPFGVATTLPSGYHPSSARRKRNLMIATVVAVAVLVVVVAIAVSLTIDSDNGSSFSGTYMEVSKVAPFTSFKSFVQPDEGNRFVVVYMNFTNEYSSDIDLNPFYFSLICANSMAYTHSWEIEYVMSDTAPAESTTPVVIYFEIPISTSPSTVQYDGVYSMYDCSAETTSAWTNTPILGPTSAHLSDISYSVVTDYDPYFPPAEGNRYINITVRITNLLTTTLDLNPFYFELSTSQGLVHEYSAWVDTPSLPEGLQSGSSTIVSIGFEIGLYEEPTLLTFDDNNYFTTISF